MQLWMEHKFVVVSVLAALLFCTTLHYRGQSRKVLRQMNARNIQDLLSIMEKTERDKQRWQREAQSSQDMHQRMRESVKEMDSRNRALMKEKNELQTKLSGGVTKEQEASLKQREEAWRKQVYVLQNATTRESKREAMERYKCTGPFIHDLFYTSSHSSLCFYFSFGPGPHHVKMTLKIPNNPDLNNTVVLELAPLNLMPHAVHLFLEQVYHELWDNTWFYLNGPHVLQAGPQDWDDDTAGKALQRFLDTQLDTLAFPEYSKDFPHVPWTLGFTGRPGGPDWYINKVDNTEPHGPGGQYQHQLIEQADPCFAKVVEGKETLEAVFGMATYPATHQFAYFLQEPVEIQTARIMETIKEGVDKPENLPRKKIPKRPRVLHKDHLPPAP